MRRVVKERIVLLTLVLVLLIACSCTVIEVKEVKDEKEELDLTSLPQPTNYENNIPPQQHRVKFEKYKDQIEGRTFERIIRSRQESLTDEMIEQLEQLPEDIRYYIYTTPDVLYMFINNAEGREELVRNADLINENDVDLILSGAAKTLEELNQWREENNIVPHYSSKK